MSIGRDLVQPRLHVGSQKRPHEALSVSKSVNFNLLLCIDFLHYSQAKVYCNLSFNYFRLIIFIPRSNPNQIDT